MTSLCCTICCEEFTAEDEESPSPASSQPAAAAAAAPPRPPPMTKNNSTPSGAAVDRHLPVVGSCGHTLCSTCVQKQWMVRVEKTQKLHLKKAQCPFCLKFSFRADGERKLNYFVLELVVQEEAARNAVAAPAPVNHPLPPPDAVVMGPREQRSLELANARLRRRLEWLNRERATWQLQQERGRF